MKSEKSLEEAEREAFEAAFNDAMGATDMPPDGFPGYDEWLFKRGWQARAASQPAHEYYVQPVPDYCDRITWRGKYFHLPLEEDVR